MLPSVARDDAFGGQTMSFTLPFVAERGATDTGEA